MAPTTRSGAKPRSETVEKLSPSIKKKTQSKKAVVRNVTKSTKKVTVEKSKAEINNGIDTEEIMEMEVNNEVQETSSKVAKKKGRAKADGEKKETNKKLKDEIEEEVNQEPIEDSSSSNKKSQSKKASGKKISKTSATLNEQKKSDAETIYGFTVKDIDGKDVPLKKYKGHVCIIVNVASRCGHTKSNYEQFVELFDKYAATNGLRILAFPCNQFGSQESGTCEKIKAFAENKGVKFDMFDKINVNGKTASPLWQFLKEKLPEVTTGKATGKDIKWNFTKFIINNEGVPVERYHSTTKPLTLVESLEKLW